MFRNSKHASPTTNLSHLIEVGSSIVLDINEWPKLLNHYIFLKGKYCISKFSNYLIVDKIKASGWLITSGIVS